MIYLFKFDTKFSTFEPGDQLYITKKYLLGKTIASFDYGGLHV